MAGILTDKFFDSPLYKALQAPYNDRMARERAASNPLAPSQGGSWPQTDSRPRSTALTPQNYTPTVLPPDNSKRLAAATQPFPLAYPPVDITVNGGNPALSASIPMPQRRPWNAPTEMDLAAIAAQQGGAMQPPMASAYAPQPAPAPAAAAASTMAQGQAPQTSWMQDLITGLGTLGGGAKGEKPQTPQQAYDAANFMASNAARNQDRSGIGTDGYVRDYFGNVIGRDGQYRGLSPSQMYDAINGNGPRPGTPGTDRNGNRIDGNPDNHTFSGDSRHDSARRARARAAKAGGGPNPLSLGMGFVGGASGIARPVTAGPVQAPRTASFSTGGGIARPVTLGPVQAPMQPGTGGPMLAPSRSIGPVTGGIMAPAQVQRQRKAPIMRSA